MTAYKRVLVALLVTASTYGATASVATAAWQERSFPPPNAGRLAFTFTNDGNPACASYDGRTCLWGQAMAEIDFSRVRPLACGAAHRNVYGVTGFEDPQHWCNIALRVRTAQASPGTSPSRAGGYRMTEWSGWGRAQGVDYRYRVGWDPAVNGPGQTVDVIYEVRNPAGQTWSGSARSLNCGQRTLWGSTQVALAAHQTREVRVRAPNCGSAQNPFIHPDMARSVRFD